MTNASIENLILANLVYNEKYVRGVLPYLKTEYFQNKNDRVLFDIIEKYFSSYNRCPTAETLQIDLDGCKNINDEQFAEINETIISLAVDSNQDAQWLLDCTESFCQKRAWYLAIMDAVKIVDDKTAWGAIPKMMADVLAISFDTKIGHEFLSDWEQRFEFYHAVENKMPFDLELMNRITHGGLPNKTLTVIMAGPSVGKSSFMNSMTTSHLRDGKNVLYITLELSEESIARRIDANLLDVSIENVVLLDKETYRRKIEAAEGNTKGRLIIKEYAAASAGASHFRHLLNELRIKKNFRPDIIYVDYLNICISSRLKMGSNLGMYSYVKSVCEEMRGLATEFNLPIVTATQTNRSGSVSSDPEFGDVAESFSTAATADLMIALVCNEEMKEKRRIMVKVLKNRFGDINLHKRFLLEFDRPKFRFCDVDQDGVDVKEDDGINFSPKSYGGKRTFDKSKFEGVV